MSESAEQIFRHAVRDGLGKLDSHVEGVLCSAIKHQYPSEVFALSFEVFSDGFTSGFPVRAFFMDRSNTEHFLWDSGQAKYRKRATAPPLQRHLKRSVSAVLTGADDDWVSRETGTCAAGAY